MGYWKTKVLPKIKKVFEKNSTKKTAAAEASKSFDESKVFFFIFLNLHIQIKCFFFIYGFLYMFLE
jgi:hypothetical protein